MKQCAILIAAFAMIGFLASESYGQRHGSRGHYHGGGSSFALSIGNGYGSGFTYGQGPRGNSFYGLSVGGGYGYAPAYRPVYRAAYPRYGHGYYGHRVHHGGGYYGGGYYGGGYRGGCGRW